MTAQRINLEWTPPGPMAAAFMRSTKRVQVLNGPIGSGKTTTNFIKAVRYAMQQKRSTRDGLRKFKLCVVRDTYRQLWKTTLPSWWKRFPKECGEWNGAENAPCTHKISFRLPDESEIAFHVDFIAIGENSVEDVMRGYEPTVWYLNEADLLAREVFNFAKGRWGRYPDMEEGGPSWWGILMDCNAPELTSWLYTDIFRSDTRPADVDLFKQPSGFSPRAENLKNLIPNYYTDQAIGQPLWYIKRMIENVPGYSRAGKPVYPEFSDELHVYRREGVEAPIAFVEGLPLLLGIDAGGSPAAIAAQRLPNNQLRILRELCADKGTGSNRFGDRLNQFLADHFPKARTIKAWADPSSSYGADKDAGEYSWLETVANKIQVHIDPAPSNALNLRHEAVRVPLTKIIDGEPALLVDGVNCPIIREGFNSGYHFKKLQGSGDVDRHAEEPDKNEHSHPHDALQYVALGSGDIAELEGRRQISGEHRAQLLRGAQHDWNPYEQV